jgi:hypothetical protein
MLNALDPLPSLGLIQIDFRKNQAEGRCPGAYPFFNLLPIPLILGKLVAGDNSPRFQIHLGAGKQKRWKGYSKVSKTGLAFEHGKLLLGVIIGQGKIPVNRGFVKPLRRSLILTKQAEETIVKGRPMARMNP